MNGSNSNNGLLWLSLIILFCSSAVSLVDARIELASMTSTDPPEDDNDTIEIMMFRFSLWHPSYTTSSTDNSNRENLVDPVVQAINLFIANKFPFDKTTRSTFKEILRHFCSFGAHIH